MESATVVKNEGTKPNPWGAVPSPAHSPWGGGGGVQQQVPCSLEDVMSEQLATDLQAHENQQFSSGGQEVSVEVLAEIAGSSPETDNDLLLAQMLQHEFDKEHDKQLKLKEAKFNGQSKVSLSFSKFRSVHPSLQADIDQEEEEEEEYDDDYEEADIKPDAVRSFKNGVSGKGKDMVSKHDSAICGRRNTSRAVDQFPLEFELGDSSLMDLHLKNKVYNELKVHSRAENKRSQRIHEKKEHYTAEHAIDEKTRLILYKMVNAEVLENVNGIISTGKEAVVFHADGGNSNDQLVPKECAVKVFKTTLNEFKNREKYVRGDFRFNKDEFKKQNPRKIIKMWAEKEMINLNRMRRFGIQCPEVVLLRKHVLVMSFVGHDQKPAPKLKEARLNSSQMQNAYAQTLEAMKRLYNDCGLVHSDLSEYNMLWHNGAIWLIDVSQSVELRHPCALEFLLRDCQNISSFFTKNNVPDVLSQYDMFNDITGMNLAGGGREFLQQIQEYEKDEEFLREEKSRKNYAFDYFFEKSVKEREIQRSKDKKNKGKEDDGSDLSDQEIETI